MSDGIPREQREQVAVALAARNGDRGDRAPEARPHIFQSARDLLNEPDPGPTPMLVEDLLTAKTVGTVLGPYKAGKTWTLLEFAVCVTSGLPAFGRYAVPLAGPVAIILEESGRAALHRRLDALSRGKALGPGDLADLHFATNRRVRLDDDGWRASIKGQLEAIGPLLVIFDPLVRLKGSANENEQSEMAPILDYFRQLRDDLDSAIVYAHHTGHKEPQRQRGSSDLEGYWESKITLSVDRKSGVRTVSAEHREAEVAPSFDWTLRWHEPSETIALTTSTADPDRDLSRWLLEYVATHPGEISSEIAKGLKRNAQKVRTALEAGQAAGQVWKASSNRDSAGQPVRKGGYYLNAGGETQPELSRPVGRDSFGQLPEGGQAVPSSAPLGRDGDSAADNDLDDDFFDPPVEAP